MKILMVSTEYPPMTGGVGRYTVNLVRALGKYTTNEVVVACDSQGAGDYAGVVSPTDPLDSDNLLRVAAETKPDVVHVQFEPGLYGLLLHPTNPKRSRTYIDSFYARCRVPIVTTFHSAYTFREWMGQTLLVNRTGKSGRLGIPARLGVKALKHLVNYGSFHDLNRDKLGQSRAGICFSNYMTRILGGGSVIYHGAEPALSPVPSKEEARQIMSLPHEKKLAVVVGFRTITKGWDIIQKMDIPAGWSVVVNSSRAHYSSESLPPAPPADRGDVIDLQAGFLSDEQLSTLLLACDAVLLPYRIASGSGVMFDALGHGLPFVASNLEFFNEFAGMNLGVVAHRDARSFSEALAELGRHYDVYSRAVQEFRHKLRWENVAREHMRIYSDAVHTTADKPQHAEAS